MITSKDLNAGLNQNRKYKHNAFSKTKNRGKATAFKRSSIDLRLKLVLRLATYAWTAEYNILNSTEILPTIYDDLSSFEWELGKEKCCVKVDCSLSRIVDQKINSELNGV